ncbi:MAG TPA: GAF domain-containing protein [Spirochaetia bacterium]|nr:GAF domain-containing protein [Spirochaetia bacterium]
MPALLILDTIALCLCALLSLALSVAVWAAGARRPLNLSFSFSVLFAGAVCAFSLLLRLSLFYHAGNPVLLLRLAATSLSIMCSFLFLFVAVYLKVDRGWLAALASVSVAGVAALASLLYAGKLILRPWLDGRGITHFDLTAAGSLAAAVPPAVLAASLVLLLSRRSRVREPFIGASIVVLLAGYLVGAFSRLSVPVSSFTGLISIAILGRGIMRHQLFNPLRELAANLEERAHRQILIARVGRRTTAILELEELLTEAVDLIKDSFAYSTVTVLLSEGDDLVLRASSLPLIHSHAGSFRLKIGLEGICGWVAATGLPLCIPDVERDPRYVTLSGHVTTRSELAVPIRRGSEVIGVLDVQSPALHAFDEGDVAAQETVADQLSSSIENARLYEKLRRELSARKRTERLLHSLNAAALAMEQALTPAEIFPIAIRELTDLGFSGAIFHADSTGKRLALACRTRDEGGVEIASGGVETSWFDLRGVPTLAEALQNQVTLSLEIDQAMITALPPLAGLRSHSRRDSRRAVFAPLSAMDELMGVLCVRGESLEAEDLAMFRAFAYQTAAAMRKVRLVQDLQSSLQQLSRTQEQLLHSQKMEAIGRLAGGIAHDFNNLLTVISGYASLLTDSVGANVTALSDLDEIRTTIKRAAGLTSRLLTFSRKQISQPLVIDLNSIVAGAQTLLRPLLGEDVELVVLLTRSPVCVRVDPYQLEQVIINLAVNARDAMSDGGRLSLETAAVDLRPSCQEARCPPVPADLATGSYAVLCVQDTGAGMPEEVLTHLFEPFFTTKEHGKGTGLGLSIVYGIITQAGGKVRVDSTPGQGSMFTVWIPRAEGVDCAKPDDSPAAGPAGTGTVLLVEDEPDVRLLTRRLLEQGGYTVLSANSAREALLIAEGSARLDVVVTDVAMPGGMSGLEMGERLSRSRPELPVLYMSGYSDDRRLATGSAGSTLPFLSKPFQPEDLLRRLSELVKKR